METQYGNVPRIMWTVVARPNGSRKLVQFQFSEPKPTFGSRIVCENTYFLNSITPLLPMPISDRNSRVLCLGLVLLAPVLVGSAMGCRSLRRSQSNATLAEARKYSLRGAEALQSNKTDDAEALFTESLRRSPQDERAHWGMAEIQWQKGNHAVATRHMQEAARISGNNPELLVRLGEMNLEQGQIAQAQAQADLALNNNRQQAEAWQLRARIASDQGQLQEAMQFYHRSLMAQPDNPPVQLALAELYQRMNRPQRALATLERMSDLRSPESQSATAWLLKGQAMASLGQTNEAKVCLGQATQQAKCDDCQTFLQIAQLNAQLGQVAEARIYLGQVLSRQPAHPEALALQSHLQQHFQSTWQDGLITNTNPTIDTVPVSAPIVGPGPALIEDNPAPTLQTPK